MSTQNEKKDTFSGSLAMGTAVGVPIGFLPGAGMDNMAVGMGTGIAIGVAIGIALDQPKKKIARKE